ncbi:disrupted in schizophrenia 1 protein [Rhinatrema bivittatum]|uniref:disrupted in schizophrenia 1 protein n=1 Tax=Rhinatrema bivittatum TaxID=194408 RepID=UPI00112A3414|nr:disrupted in schizophrenia 1 protein [Rhinatrema bivittatum]
MRTETQQKIKFQAFSGQLEQGKKQDEESKCCTVDRQYKYFHGSSLVNDSVITNSMQTNLTTTIATVAAESRNLSDVSPQQSENVSSTGLLSATPQKEFPPLCYDLLEAGVFGTESKTFSCVKGKETQKMNVSCQKKENNNYESEERKFSGHFTRFPDTFNSSFNFIQLSLNAGFDTVNQSPEQVPSVIKPDISKGLSEIGPGSCSDCLPDSKVSCCHSNKDFECAMQALVECDKLQVCKIFSFLDLDTTFYCSTDSDAVSAGSSVTSGYESSITANDVSWNTLTRKYDSVLSDCLLNNQAALKIKSLRLKLQRLQEKAVQKDDYEKGAIIGYLFRLNQIQTFVQLRRCQHGKGTKTKQRIQGRQTRDERELADEYQKKSEELEQEMKTLKFQLPSRHPSICIFLDRFRAAVQAALYWMADGVTGKGKWIRKEDKQKHTGYSHQELRQISSTRREQLLQEKRHLQKEIECLKVRLAMLETKDQQLGVEIEEHDRLIQMQDCELTSLLTCVPLDELHEINKALDEILASSCRNSLSLEVPDMLKSLQEKEQSLIVSIKETTNKICTSQKLCSTLRRKVGNIEAQLPALLEAKILAVSGNHFCTAKEIIEEIKSLMSEKQGLEQLHKELLLLSTKNDRKLEKIKEDHSRLKQEVEQGEAAFEKNLKDHAVKYMDMLEDKLHRCGSQLLEKVWEADLEACQLLVRGFQEEESSYHVPECGESQTDEERADGACSDSQGRNECLFLKAFKADSSTIQQKHCELKGDFHLISSEMREKCEMISEKLKHLEDQLQIAVCNHDEGLVQSLQKEIQMVKETLQTMLVQLQAAKNQDDVEDLCDSW